jgi:hypothetical protein
MTVKFNKFHFRVGYSNLQMMKQVVGGLNGMKYLIIVQLGVNESGESKK